jgi:hypothetical protein
VWGWGSGAGAPPPNPQSPIPNPQSPLKKLLNDYFNLLKIKNEIYKIFIFFIYLLL